MADDPLNKDCFFPPKLTASQDGARGIGPQGRNGGMTRMDRVHLNPGVYYRFCDSKTFHGNPKKAMSGPWWTEPESFEAVRAFARRHAHIREFAGQHGQSGISYSAKLHFAIPYEWGDCGWVVEARLNTRLDAFKGWGDIAQLSNDPAKRNAIDGGAKYIPLIRPEVFQLYVPEIWLYFDQAFTVLRQGHAAMFA